MIDPDRDGGPAYPSWVPREQYRDHGYEWVRDRYDGMSLRDHFAAHALVGIVGGIRANPADRIDRYNAPALAEKAYHFADAMLLERTRPRREVTPMTDDPKNQDPEPAGTSETAPAPETTSETPTPDEAPTDQ